MSDDQLYVKSDLHLVYLGQDIYGELKEKPAFYNQPDSTEHTSAGNSYPSDEQTSITDTAKTVNDEKLKHIAGPEDKPEIIQPDVNTENAKCSTVTSIQDKSVLPPLVSIVLPLFLQTCKSPLVNPVVDYDNTSSNTKNCTSDGDSPLTIPESSPSIPSVKSRNSKTFNLNDIMIASACKRNYSVIIEKLSTDVINLWTGQVPHWSTINPYSSLSEIDGDQSENESERVTSQPPSSDTNDLPTHNLRT